ncbi:MAG: PadR family transcriptional regulator [Acidobacteriota bacterium]
MAKSGQDLLRGTLDSLVLKTLSGGPRHGYGIARFLEERSNEQLQIEEGSLYPALYRLEKRGWIESEWGKSELGRRAKFYRLTAVGRKQLNAETERWRAFSQTVSDILLA